MPTRVVSPDDPAFTPLVCTVEEASRLVGYSTHWLNKARMTGEGPRFIKRPRKILYEVTELRRWLSAQGQFSSTAEYTHPVSKEGLAA
jgi:hypothetical protein